MGASMIALTPVVSNDVAADIQHGVVNAEHRAVALADTVVNPIQSWMDLIQTTQTNLQTVTQDFLSLPFPAAQQLAANWLQYGDLYVSTMQTGAINAVSYFTESGANDFLPLLQSASSDLISGNVEGSINNLIAALYTYPFTQIGQPLEATLDIPKTMSTNFGNAVNTLLGSGVTDLGVYLVFAPKVIGEAFGSSLQLAVNSANSGDLVGAFANLLDVPPVTLDAIINGSGTPPDFGLINTPYAGLYVELSNISKLLAQAIVAPNSQNIVNGGSLPVATQEFLTQLTTGWPSLQTAFNQLLNTVGQLLGGGGAAATAGFVNADSAMAGLAAGLPGLSTDLLKGFDPAAVTNIAGWLGTSMATDIAAALPADIAGVLPGDVPAMAGRLGADLASVLPGMILSVLHF
ncbi:hypothetical protein BST29_24525 [Mycobacterium malmoense]|uniref:PE-PGRS family protein n=1 Tax=Mycobacterium malmoense TaxID=1780 RepID=A0ABX3SKB1_MYCMA|nr:hypothetical protein BST29_24525 [Mycobacterium malmoense]